ncbi:glycosyltransferase family 8 protein [Chamaesiphon sp. VAR_48_metabat_135_sub]|uniref:glycosyltransferase family 8 protein n=1 Tax=Chamaesiphon sp. VAR_48_metabat_135_sub TaxID=2964699 RepID=UPI00286BF733|nr:glycosyltransferase family 8 protein [Chamaesiphon sp. VAR_48_metabat_135_sub]
MTSTVSVALCADKNIEVGLHVTLYSLLQSSHHFIRIYLLQKGYRSADIAKIHRTLVQFDGKYEIRVINFDDRIFSRFRGLHGNKFAYARIMLANIVSEARIIYLDSDLVIAKDLGSLFFKDLGTYIIGASGITTMKCALDRTLFSSIGLEQEAKYFNSGVILMDLDAWRQADITKKCFDFADEYTYILDADQAILNYVFYKNNFCELDKSYNHALYPTSKYISPDLKDSIFHFVGSPKPWDFLGEVIHKNHPLFQSILIKTAFNNYKTCLDFSVHRTTRTLRLGRSYYNCLKQQSKQKKVDLN